MASGGADRDVTVDVVARDKTGPGITSTERNLKRTARQAKDTRNALEKIADQWGRNVTRMGGAAKRWADSGDTSGKRFVKGALAGLSKLGEIGSTVGGHLSKAVSAAGPYVQVAVGALLAGAAVAAAPAMAGAIVGGAGLGGIVGGVMLATRDARVKSALDALKEEAGDGLTEAARRFVPATLESVSIARQAYKGMLPDLRRLFDVSATWLPALTSRIGAGAQSALSGITAAITKAGPIITVIGESIDGLLDSVGDGFRMLSDNGASMALALKAAFLGVEILVRGTFFVLNLLVEAFEWFVSKIPGGARLLEHFAAKQDGAKGSALNLAGGLQTLAAGADDAGGALTRAKAAADAMVGSNIGLARAQIASREATATATQAIKDNANAKLTNRQRADQNMGALLNLADAFNTEASAGESSKISAEQASNAYHNNRAALIKAARAAGMTQTAAEKLAAEWLRVPKNVNTDVNANTGAATAAVTSFQKKVNGLKGKTVMVTVRVTSKGDHYIPGVGTQLKGYAGAWGWSAAPSEGAGTARTGGPTRVEVQTKLAVSLDGKPFRDFTARAVSDADKRRAWRDKVGTR